MKNNILMLSASALLVFGGAVAHAATANREVTDYLQRAGTRATADVAAAGVDVGEGLTVKVRVSSDGRLDAVRVAQSSGSLEADQKATQALRRFKVAQPPTVLIGAEVSVAVGKAPLLTARNP